MVNQDSPSAVSTDGGSLYHLLDSATENWFEHWLNFLSRYIRYSSAVVLVREADTGTLKNTAYRGDETALESLQEAAEQAIQQQKPVLAPIDEKHCVAAWPYIESNTCEAVVALIVPLVKQSQLEQSLVLLEWCAGWLELKLLKKTYQQLQLTQTRRQTLLEGFSVLFEYDAFPASALSLVNFIARQLECERVVLAYVKKDVLEISCQSDSNEYTERLGTTALCLKAMQETWEQLEPVCWPEIEGQLQINRAHKSLCDYMEQSAALSVPLVDKEYCYGVMLFERISQQPFSGEEKIYAESLANVLAIALEQKRQAQKPVLRLIADALHNHLQTFLRPGYLWRKVSLLVVVFSILFFSVARGEYRLAADAVVEGAEIRALAAPFDGFLEAATVRAGDTVKEHASLAKLDTRELRLQRIKMISEQAQTQRQHEDALSRQDRAQVQVLNAQNKRIAAELGLIEFQLAQADIKSPFDAIVVSGDLSQRIGTAVKQGDVLFELAPNDRYRLALMVNEFRINDLSLGQKGRLVLAALPDELFEFEVSLITLVAEPYEGDSVYRVEALLTSAPDNIRPGLKGVAKVSVDERLLIDIWTRGFRDWFSLQWWRFWG